MYCPRCNWDYRTDANHELSGEGTCPGCGAKYGFSKGSSDDNGHHETGADASEGDYLLYEMDGDD